MVATKRGKKKPQKAIFKVDAEIDIFPDLGTIDTAFGVLDKVIALGEKIYNLITPNYEEFAKQMNELYSKMFQANAKLSEWISSFINFNFSQENAYGTFLDLVTKFETWRCGEEYAKLARTYVEIKRIYEKNIHSELKKFIGEHFSQKEFKEAEKLFSDLTGVNRDMIGFFYRFAIPQLKTEVEKMVALVNKKKSDEANNLRIELRQRIEPVVTKLEFFADRLRDVGNSYVTYVRGIEDSRREVSKGQIARTAPIRCPTCGTGFPLNPCKVCCTWFDDRCRKFYKRSVERCMYCGLKRVRSDYCQ